QRSHREDRRRTRRLAARAQLPRLPRHASLPQLGAVVAAACAAPAARHALHLRAQAARSGAREGEGVIRKLLHHPYWPAIKKWGGALFLLVVLALLVRYATKVDWAKVKQSVLELPRPVLLQALGFAALSHLVYSLMDVVGHRYTGHHMQKRQVMLVS